MGEEYYLRWQQEQFYTSAPFCALLGQLRVKYAPYFEPFTTTIDEADDHHADPHPKKLLRIDAWGALCDSSLRGRLWLRTVLYKLKRIEIAKPGKYGRMIGDLGVSASLQGFRVTNFLKMAQDSERIDFCGGYARFVKSPAPEVLKEAFDDLINPPGQFVYIFFSDDACLSRRKPNGEVEMYNMDISSCDASHGPMVFDALINLAADPVVRDALRVLVEQCQLPIRLEDARDRARVLVLKPAHPRLYSGSTITTAINNLANISIALAVALNPMDSPAVSARLAGYNVTAERCDVVEDLQFLKHSPVLTTDDEYQPLLNIGVLMRLSGSCKGDLPGTGDLHARAADFQAALIQGVSTYSRYTLLDNMRSVYPSSTVVAQQAVRRELGDDPKFTMGALSQFVDESIYKRYRLTDLEIEEVLDFSRGTVGYNYGGTAFSKILAKDYGLSA